VVFKRLFFLGGISTIFSVFKYLAILYHFVYHISFQDQNKMPWHGGYACMHCNSKEKWLVLCLCIFVYSNVLYIDCIDWRSRYLLMYKFQDGDLDWD